MSGERSTQRRRRRRWRERWRRVRIFSVYLQNLQIAQRSESSIFDAADVIAVQLPAPQTHTSDTQKCTHMCTRTRRDKGERERGGESQASSRQDALRWGRD